MPFNITKALVFLGIAAVSSIQCQAQIISKSNVKVKPVKHIELKDHFCSLIQKHKLKCQVKGENSCQGVSSDQKPVCAFNQLQEKFQFNRQCQACQYEGTKQYFLGKCHQAPRICHPHQQCINGLCVEMLTEKKYQNLQQCNVDTDCKNKSYLCVANKCVKKTQIAKILHKTQKKHPEINQLGRLTGQYIKNIQAQQTLNPANQQNTQQQSVSINTDSSSSAV